MAQKKWNQLKFWNYNFHFINFLQDKNIDKDNNMTDVELDITNGEKKKR